MYCILFKAVLLLSFYAFTNRWQTHNVCWSSVRLSVRVSRYLFNLAALNFCFKTCVAMKFVDDDDDDELVRRFQLKLGRNECEWALLERLSG